jgi:hypothetical protein
VRPRQGELIATALSRVTKFLSRLDIMASTAEQLEEAFQKLQRWCLFEFRQLGRDAHVEVEPIMTESVRRLRKRPALLQ